MTPSKDFLGSHINVSVDNGIVSQSIVRYHKILISKKMYYKEIAHCNKALQSTAKYCQLYKRAHTASQILPPCKFQMPCKLRGNLPHSKKSKALANSSVGRTLHQYNRGHRFKFHLQAC